MIGIFFLYKNLYKEKDSIINNAYRSFFEVQPDFERETLYYFSVHKILIFMIGIFSTIYLIGNIFLSILAFDDYSKINEKKKNYNIFNIFFVRFTAIFSWFIFILFFIFYVYYIFYYINEQRKLTKYCDTSCTSCDN